MCPIIVKDQFPSSFNSYLAVMTVVFVSTGVDLRH